MRKLAFLLFSFFCFTSFAHAQETWQLWLYSASNGEAYLVGSDGAVQANLLLPVPAVFVSYEISPYIAVSPDAQRLAYSIRGKNADDVSIAIFQVYDVPNDRLLFSFEPPQGMNTDSLAFSAAAWNRTGNTVAYAYTYGSSEDDDAWEIRVFNAIDGRVISEISPTSGYFANQSLESFLLPVLQFHAEASLSFSLFPYQNDASSALKNYDWDLVTGRVVETNRAPNLLAQSWQITGETIMPIVDDRVTYDASFAPYTNALQVYRPEIASRAPFFASSGYDLLEAYFVENGQKILIRGYDLLAQQDVYLLVNRAGVSRTLPQIRPLDSKIIGTPTGFAYVIDNATPFLINLDTRDDAFNQSAIWQAPPDSRFVPIWASSLPDTAYEAWGQLAPPLALTLAQIVPQNSVSADGVATITPIGSTGGFLTVNTVAVTYTTSGDRLNMRDEPSLTGAIIARVDPGSRVVITDGPVAQDGYTWWEIRLATGQLGWVVERTEGIQTLIPAN